MSNSKTILVEPEEISTGNSPDWLESLKRESLNRYNSLDLPLRSNHLWRYTDPEKFLYSGNGVKPAVSSDEFPGYKKALEQLQKSELSAVVADHAGREIEVNLGQDISNNKDIFIAPLREAIAQRPELVKTHLGSVVGSSFGKFEALNSSLWADGILVYIPKGMELEKPIHLFHRGSTNDKWTFVRVLIIAEEASSVTILDEYLSANDDVAGKSNSVVEIFGKRASKIQYVALQRNNRKTISHYSQRTLLDDDANSTLVIASFGGKLSKSDLGAVLKGKHAESRQYGLVFGSGKQLFDHHTVHIHKGSHGYSNLDFKVALKDKSRSIYTGLIRVDEGTPYCEAYQTNRNLLLNKGARAESIPELEILCDEVICTHGATIGPIDPMEVFYLNSRGVSRQEAVRMIVRGHVEPTLKELSDVIRERVSEFVEERLNSL